MSETPFQYSTETRHRLLASAGEVFAEKGFQYTTIRDICQRAGANGAAVNYHFGDKRALYLAVLQSAHRCANDMFPPQVPEDAPAEDRLADFVLQFLRRLLDPGRPSWHGRLMAREINEPTGALEELVQSEVRPRMMALFSIIRDLIGELPPDVLARCAASVIGQMLHYHFARPVMNLLNPVFADLHKQLPELARHITQFSIGGIRGIADQYRKDHP